MIAQLSRVALELHQYMDNFKWENAPFGLTMDNLLLQTALPVGLYCFLTVVLQKIFNPPGKDGVRKYAREDEPASGIMMISAVLHNFTLSALSAIMFYGMFVKGFWHVFQRDGFYAGIADSKGHYWNGGETSFWIWLFMVSKWLEFVDTFIRIFMRKNVSFFHWWHHATVPIHMWLMLVCKWDIAVFGFCFNAFVHVIMYLYYGLVAQGIRVWWKKLVTQVQIVQFVSCFVILGWVLVQPQFKPTQSDKIALYSTFTLYLSYLLLFLQFYLSTYKKPQGPKTETKKQ